jgi:hypothetical protein
LFNFILILYFTASQFLIQFSNVLAKMININYAYLIFFPFKTPFYILLFILSLGVSLFLVNYKSRTNLVLTTNL